MKSLKRTEYDYKKSHFLLDKRKTVGGVEVFCTHCKKILEKRDSFPDYGMFMGGVWIKQNLPCNPYEKELK